MKYNTRREHLMIPEYGRAVQEMIEYALTIEDREKRTMAARQIVMVMGQLTNSQREGSDFKQKLWDHLFIMSDYKLDVDAPFPMPEARIEHKPVKPHYPHTNIRFKQYGKNIELMIEKTIAYEDGEEKETLKRYLANYLKRMYLNWNRETVQDDLIGQHLSMLSNGRLELPEDTKLEVITDIAPQRQNTGQNKKKKYSGQNKQGGNPKNFQNYNRKKQRKQQG